MRTDAAQPGYQPQTARHGDKRFVFTGPEAGGQGEDGYVEEEGPRELCAEAHARDRTDTVIVSRGSAGSGRATNSTV
jgi:hypothetical protein